MNSRDSITREEFRLIHSHLPPTILIAMISGCIETDGTNVRSKFSISFFVIIIHFYRLARSQYQIRFSCMFSIDFNSILQDPDQSKSGIHILEQVAFPNGQDTVYFTNSIDSQINFDEFNLYMERIPQLLIFFEVWNPHLQFFIFLRNLSLMIFRPSIWNVTRAFLPSSRPTTTSLTINRQSMCLRKLAILPFLRIPHRKV